MKTTKKTRLSSKKALEALKFLVKKKFGAEEVDWNLFPFDSMAIDDFDWSKVSANITFKDGKGFTSSIMVAYRGYGAQRLEVRHSTTTWSTLLRKMEREANCEKKAAFFSLQNRNLFEPGDSIEKILIEMTLENSGI